MSGSLFTISWNVGIASWFLGIVEMIGMVLFSRLAFRLGPCILREERSIIDLGSSEKWNFESFETDDSKFKFVAVDECLARQKFRLLDFRMDTMLPIKCRIQLREDRIAIEGRIPLFAVVLVGALLVGWSSVSVANARHDPLPGGLFSFVGAVFIIAGCVLSIVLGRRGTRALLTEFESKLAASRHA